MGAMDAGIVSQNISIFCSAARLATVPRASMDINQLKKVLKLKERNFSIQIQSLKFCVQELLMGNQ